MDLSSLTWVIPVSITGGFALVKATTAWVKDISEMRNYSLQCKKVKQEIKTNLIRSGRVETIEDLKILKKVNPRLDNIIQHASEELKREGHEDVLRNIGLETIFGIFSRWPIRTVIVVGLLTWFFLKLPVVQPHQQPPSPDVVELQRNVQTFVEEHFLTVMFLSFLGIAVVILISQILRDRKTERLNELTTLSELASVVTPEQDV